MNLTSSISKYMTLIFKVFKYLAGFLCKPKKLLQIINSKRKKMDQDQLNSLWSNQNYILSQIALVSPGFYEEHKGITEIEHQVGRYLNMQIVCREIAADKIEGDIVEFGTWQGLGLILLANCFDGEKIQRKLIGIDSFEGLPESSTIWIKGAFSNTSLGLVEKNIQSKIALNSFLSVMLIKGFFSDSFVGEQLASTCKEIALIHFDADLGSSTTQALSLIEPYLVNRAKPIYFLFDDWGCHPDEVPDAFLTWLPRAINKFKLQAYKLSSTRFTRYYKITFDH